MGFLLGAGHVFVGFAGEGLGGEELDEASGEVVGEGVVGVVEFEEGGAAGSGEADGVGGFLGGFEDRVDVGVGDAGAGGVVEEDVGGVGGELLEGGVDLVEPLGATGGDLDAGEGEVVAETLLGVVELLGLEDDEDLPDALAIDEEFRGAEEGFFSVDLDGPAAGFDHLARWGSGEEDDGKGCHGDILGSVSVTGKRSGRGR